MHASEHTARSAERGFSLIEVVIAIIILSIVSLSLGKFVGKFSHAVGTSTARTTAVSVAQEQIETIKTQGNSNTALYAGLVGTYNNASLTGFPGYPSMNRMTRVVRTTGGNPPRDFTTITVTVSEPTMGTPVSITTVMAAP
jgi:prepilin-type N-terminal cleavage/methylation domain-containing protein